MVYVDSLSVRSFVMKMCEISDDVSIFFNIISIQSIIHRASNKCNGSEMQVIIAWKCSERCRDGYLLAPAPYYPKQNGTRNKIFKYLLVLTFWILDTKIR